MYDHCFRCGQPGHFSADCPQRDRHPAPSGSARAPSWKAPPPPPDRHAYPDDHYLLYVCDWCGSAPFNLCTNTATGRTRTPHNARTIRIQ